MRLCIYRNESGRVFSAARVSKASINPEARVCEDTKMLLGSMFHGGDDEPIGGEEFTPSDEEMW